MQWSSNRLVLGSTSPRRAELLSLLGIEFDVIAPNVDESPLVEERPSELAARLADLKGQSVLSGLEAGRLVLAADTVVSLDGRIFGKPVDRDDAMHMLGCLRGEVHDVWSALWLGCVEVGVVFTTTVKTQVFVRSVSDEELLDYISLGESLDKAGGYGIQGRGSTLISAINGDYYAVVGLPLSALWEALRSLEFL